MTVPDALSADRLTETFTALAQIDGVSLAERAIADHVTHRLRALGVEVTEDDAGAALGGTAGNLVAIGPNPDDSGRPEIVLTCHLDTVKPTAALRPTVADGAVRSDGTTILGADNRAGVAVLVSLLQSLTESGTRHRPFRVAFTVAEEIGLLGAGQLALTAADVAMGFTFDCSKRPGIFIAQAPGLSAFTAIFHGKASHAGVAPEAGVSAIRLAARALADVPIGRWTDGTTLANLGTISGGEATNVVAAKVTVEGEVRGRTAADVAAHLTRIETIMRDALGEEADRLEFTHAVEFAPFTLQPDADIYRETERVLTAAGLKPEGIAYAGGSDANVFNAKGIPTVNLGIGAQNPHADSEFILTEDLAAAGRIAWALVTGEATA